MHLFKIFSVLFLSGFILISAKPPKDKVVDIKESTGDIVTANVSEDIQIETFIPIYVNILETSCNVPTCHDGSFEPNFSSLQAAYYTTVKHVVFKNDLDKSFDYRIHPNNPKKSMLFERITNCCFSDPQDKMPLLFGDLNKNQIDSISAWIEAGAPDWKGEFPYKNQELIDIE